MITIHSSCFPYPKLHLAMRRCSREAKIYKSMLRQLAMFGTLGT